MTNIFVFLKESDSEAIRRSHRRHARELAAGMSQPASQRDSDRGYGIEGVAQGGFK